MKALVFIGQFSPSYAAMRVFSLTHTRLGGRPHTAQDREHQGQLAEGATIQDNLLLLGVQ
jgi:hypothetical protein